MKRFVKFWACAQLLVLVCAGHAQGQSPFGPPDGDNEYAAIGTIRAPGNLAHATEGDGITLMEEYRGFLFDGGPGTFNGGHTRLTPVIKEVLIQLCVMDDYMADRGTGEGVNPNLTSNLDLDAVMKEVSNFYIDKMRGAGIHLYWSKTPFTMPVEPHTYTNGEYCANLYRHSGSITIQKRLPGSNQLTVITNAGAWVYNDLRLSIENPQKHEQLFKETGLYRGPQLFIYRNRDDVRGRHFIKVIIPSRMVFRDTHGKCRMAADVNAWTSPVGDPYQFSGVCVDLLNLADENIFGTDGLHYAHGWIAEHLKYAIAHEIAHLLGLDDDYTGTGTLMQKFCPLNQIRFSPLELQGIDVKGRRSVAP